jgi:hypothetical protein
MPGAYRFGARGERAGRARSSLRGRAAAPFAGDLPRVFSGFACMIASGRICGFTRGLEGECCGPTFFFGLAQPAL